MDPIWTALLKRDITKMNELLNSNKDNANAPHPKIATEKILDSALYFGFFEESKLLFEFGGKPMKPALPTAIMNSKADFVEWIYNNLDSDVNNVTIPTKIFSSNKQPDEEKLNVFKFLISKGADYKNYIFYSVVLSPLCTKNLIEQNLINFDSVFEGRTLNDEIELRNLQHPLCLYLLPSKTNGNFTAINNNSMVDLYNSLPTNDIEYVFSENVGTALCYALSRGNYGLSLELIKRGANPQYETKYKKNCLHFAVEGGDINCVNLARELIKDENKIDQIYKDQRNMECSVLKLALIYHRNKSIFLSLLKPYLNKRGANPNLKYNNIDVLVTLGSLLKWSNVEDHVELYRGLVDAGLNKFEYNPYIRNTSKNYYLEQLGKKSTPQNVLDEIEKY
jgi:hypothetical protein